MFLGKSVGGGRHAGKYAGEVSARDEVVQNGGGDDVMIYIAQDTLGGVKPDFSPDNLP